MQHRVFWEKEAGATGAKEVTPSWLGGYRPSDLPDSSRGNHSPDLHAEPPKTSQHNAGAAISLSNKQSKLQGAKAHKAPTGIRAGSPGLTLAMPVVQRPEVILPHGSHTAELCPYQDAGVLHSQRQPQQPRADIPLQEVDQGLVPPEEQKIQR